MKNYENRVFWWPEQIENSKIPKFWWPEHEQLWKSRLLVARTCGTSQNSEVLVAKTWKNYEHRVLSWPTHVENLKIPKFWPEHLENLKIPKFWWPEHETTMKIASSGGQNK